MENLINSIAGYIWGNALVFLSLAVGLYFTLATKGVQFRYFFEMLRLLRENKTSEEGISSFQAFCMALSGRIGVGNIAGVATAIAAGGPGAIFWMVAMGLLGGASAFVESTLAQIYKQRADGQYRGGAPYYIEKGLKLKSFAIFFAAVICISYGILVPGIQARAIATSFTTSFGLSPAITGAIVTLLMAYLIFGGVKRIARAADKIVPIMAFFYIVMMVIILVSHWEKVPSMFRLIFDSAIGTHAIFGGMVGTAVSWGVRRAVFSNVAGAGEATFSSASAEVSHPAKQGLIQAFSIYIDTVLVCTASGLMILVTGMYNVFPDGGSLSLVENIPGVAAGAEWTQRAVSTVFTDLGAAFVSIAIFLFAFTTLMAYYYIAETTIVYLDRKLRYPLLKLALKIIFLAVIFLGSVQSITMMWSLGDIGFGSMSYLNLIVIVLLSKPAFLALKDYERQKKMGINPVFDPDAAGIKEAELWGEISKQYK